VGRFGAAAVGGPPSVDAAAAEDASAGGLAEVQAAADEAVQETEAAVSAAHAEVREALEAAQQASAVSEPPLRQE
jgi:hypothetical protein